MTSSARALLLTVCLLALPTAPDLRADILDVEGEGVLDGTVVESNEEQLTFLDSYGNLRTFDRRRVTVIESTRSRGPAGDALESARKRARTLTSQATRWKEAAEGFAESPESALLKYRRSVETSLDWLSRRMSAGRKEALDAFYHGTDIERVLDYLLPDFTSCLERFGGQPSWAAAAALLLAAAGAAAFAYALIRLVVFYFERGAWRGLAGLSLAVVPAAGWIGGLAGDAAAVVPVFLNAYLLTVFWNDVKQWVVLQFFGIDAVLLGYWILRAYP